MSRQAVMTDAARGRCGAMPGLCCGYVLTLRVAGEYSWGVAITPLILEKVRGGAGKFRQHIRFLRTNALVSVPKWMVHELVGITTLPDTHVACVRVLIDKYRKTLYFEPYLLPKTDTAHQKKLPDPSSLKLFVYDRCDYSYRMAGRSLRQEIGLGLKKARVYRAFLQHETGRIRIPLLWLRGSSPKWKVDPDNPGGPTGRTRGEPPKAKADSSGSGESTGGLRGRPPKEKK